MLTHHPSHWEQVKIGWGVGAATGNSGAVISERQSHLKSQNLKAKTETQILKDGNLYPVSFPTNTTTDLTPMESLSMSSEKMKLSRISIHRLLTLLLLYFLIHGGKKAKLLFIIYYISGESHTWGVQCHSLPGSKGHTVRYGAKATHSDIAESAPPHPVQAVPSS